MVLKDNRAPIHDLGASLDPIGLVLISSSQSGQERRLFSWIWMAWSFHSRSTWTN
ncbi:hypothetical protein ACSBR1_040466 [Camellia fascicularis]